MNTARQGCASASYSRRAAAFHLKQLSVNPSVPKVCCASPVRDLSGDPGVHRRESPPLPSRGARFRLPCKCTIIADVSPSHLHPKGQYSAFPNGRSRRRWPVRQPGPSTKVLSWTISSYSLFKHLVAQSVHLIKPEISFPPVGSAAIHLSQSTHRDRFGRRCLFFYFHLPASIFPDWNVALRPQAQLAEAMPGLAASQPEHFNRRITRL